MLKICVLTTVHVPDDNRVFHKELKSLKKLGYDIIYVAPGVESGKRDGIEYVNYQKKNNRFFRMLDFFNVYKTVKKLGCDVCHFHDVEGILVGLLLKATTKIKVVYDVHEDYRNQMANKYYMSSYLRKIFYKVIAFIESRANKKFDYMITADNGTKKYFDANKTEVLFNFPKLSDYTQINLDAPKKYDLVFLGSTSKFILNIMLECTAKLKAEGYNIKALMVKMFHFANSEEYVKQRMLELNLTDDDFVVMDRLATIEVPNFLAQSKIGMLPLDNTKKNANNIPTKLFEDMLCGLPVICSDLAPSRSFIENEDVGFLVEYNDVDAYIEKIKLLLDNEQLRTDMGKTARNLVIEKYNWENEEKKLAEIYKSLA